jgi:serine/threonine-protein kinase
MSPEQARGEPADERSDVYSLGVVMYQMLLGRPPFEGELMAVVTQHLQSPPPPVDQQEDSPEMPDPLAQIVMRMLAKDPNDRFPGMGEVREALARIPMVTEPIEA